MIALARGQVPTGTFFVKDIKEPLGLKSMFDGVFAQAVLLHVPKIVYENRTSSGGTHWIQVVATNA